jgi:hypothetical protein
MYDEEGKDERHLKKPWKMRQRGILMSDVPGLLNMSLTLFFLPSSRKIAPNGRIRE